MTADGAGSYGIEQQYNTILAGKPELIAALRDGDGNVLQSSEQIVDPGTPGQSIRLTIDASLQLQLEKELYAAWVADGARRRARSCWIRTPARCSPGRRCPATTRTTTRHRRRPTRASSGPGDQPGLRARLGHEDVHGRGGDDGGTVRPGTIVHDRRQMKFGPQTIHNSDHQSMGADDAP